MPYTPIGQVKWRLSGSGLSTTIAAGSGNSGTWGLTPPVSYPYSPVDIGGVTDLSLYVFTGTKTASASLVVNLDLYDDDGNLFPAVMSTAAITASGAAPVVTCGLHGTTAGTYLVLPSYARVSWVLSGSGASFAGVEITLYGR